MNVWELIYEHLTDEEREGMTGVLLLILMQVARGRTLEQAVLYVVHEVDTEMTRRGLSKDALR